MTPMVRLIRWLTGCLALCLAVSGFAAVVGALIFFWSVRDLPSVPEPLRRIIETPPTEIYAANGERVLQIGGHDYVPLDQVSIVFLEAILATEDHLFWEHHGVNKVRLFKALWSTFFSGRVQGASTITQQLAKNLFFSFEQTYQRKFRELLVALQIESQFSKRDILEAYVNQIYFGPRAQGVAAAARAFFAKTPGQLTVAEAALLAGLPKSPVRYNPLRHYERAKARQQVVLDRMVAAGFIEAQEAAAAAAEEMTFASQGASGTEGGYFVDWVFKQLEERYGAQVVYHGGLKVTTTMDPQLQKAAQTSLARGLNDLAKSLDGSKSSAPAEAPQGALVAIQVNSGAIKAMVGGRNYAESEYNRAVQNQRLPGSAFKPFLYYAALETLGVTPATVFVDEPVRIPIAGAPDWRPQNFKRTYQGPVILKKSFTQSINSIAAQLVERTGPEAVIDVARRCGIQSPLAPVYSVALGTSGVSPLEMASGFATFAAEGVRYEPFAVWRVEDAYGQLLEEHIVSGTQTLDSRLVYQVVDMMKGVVDHGTGEVVRRMGFKKPAAGKTGTTNGYNDAWFAGFTPTLCASVWVGYDREEGLLDRNGVGITGSRGAAPIWAQFMINATEGEPPRPFLQPAGIRLQTVDSATGLPTNGNNASDVWVALREGF